MIFTGTHVIGRGRARKLGFPTINLHQINTILIENGVYAAIVTINNTQFKAALFIGESPTFKDKEKTVELYLIGLTPSDVQTYKLTPLITSKITVETIAYIRPVIKFSSKETLIEQIEKDVAQILTVLP